MHAIRQPALPQMGTEGATDEKAITGGMKMARYDLSMTAQSEVSPGAAADVLFELGMVYYFGRDVEPDIAEAHKWFNLAAIKGHEKARQYRSELATDMDSEQLRDALARARAWLGLH